MPARDALAHKTALGVADMAIPHGMKRVGARIGPYDAVIRAMRAGIVFGVEDVEVGPGRRCICGDRAGSDQNESES